MLIVYISNRMDNNNADYSMKGGAASEMEEELTSKEYIRAIDNIQTNQELQSDLARSLTDELDNGNKLYGEYSEYLVYLLMDLKDSDADHIFDPRYYYGIDYINPKIRRAIKFYKLPDEENHYAIMIVGTKNFDDYILPIIIKHINLIKDTLDTIIMPPPGVTIVAPQIIHDIKVEVDNFDPKIHQGSTIPLLHSCMSKVWCGVERSKRQLSFIRAGISQQHPVPQFNLFDYIIELKIDLLLRSLKKIPQNNPFTRNLIIILTVMKTNPVISIKLTVLCIATNISLKMLKDAGKLSKCTYDTLVRLMGIGFSLMKVTGRNLFFTMPGTAVRNLQYIADELNEGVDDEIKNQLQLTDDTPQNENSGYVTDAVNDLRNAVNSIEQNNISETTKIALGISDAGQWTMDNGRCPPPPTNYWQKRNNTDLQRSRSVYRTRNMGAAAIIGSDEGDRNRDRLSGGAIKTKKSKPKSSKGKSKKYLKIKKSKKSKNSTKKKVQRKKSKKPLSASRRSQ